MATSSRLHSLLATATRTLAISLACSSLGAVATAQTTFPEIEPNSNKAEATSVSGMTAGDAITGVSTGPNTTALSTLITTVDNFRVRTRQLPLGIYRHTLTLTSVVVGHTGTLRGLNQTGTVGVGGTAGTVDTAFQTSATTPSNTWYGFGKQEELYYRIAGFSATTATYGSVLSTTPITPIVAAGPFVAGMINITSVGQGHTTDTDMWLYDSNFNAISAGGNDDDPAIAPALQSRILRSLAPGQYYVAVGTFSTANNQVAAFDDNFVMGALMDFPDVIVNNVSSAVLTPVNISVSDGTTTTPLVLNRSSAFEIVWVTFSLGFTDTILAGSDIFVSPAGGSSVDFSLTPLPAGFFGPGSDPFTGLVTLGGSPLAGTGLAGGTDTIVRRLTNVPLVGCPSGGGVPIEIVALNLVSVQPITVTFNGGTSSSTYNVQTALSTTAAQQLGTMAIQRTGLDGGTFNSNLPVTPRAVFTKVAGALGNPNVTADPAPSVAVSAGGPWSYDDGGIGVPHSPGGLVDHDANTGSPLRPYPATTNFIPGLLKQGVNCGGPGVSPRRVTIPHVAPTHTHTVTPPVQTPPSQCVTFCLGDGSGNPCPCNNHSIVGDDKGCLNSLGIGGRLRCDGIARVSADTFKLLASNLDAGGAGLYIQSNGLVAGGAILGDGKLCAAIGIIRLGVVFAVNNASMYPSGALPAVSVAGLCNPGDLRHYQLWYRNNAPFCTPDLNNLTNGVSVLWQ